MVKKITYLKERLIYFAKSQGVSVEDFLHQIGMTYGSFKGEAKKRSLNSDAIVKLLTMYPDVNLKWVFTGEGDMLSNGNDHSINNSSQNFEGDIQMNVSGGKNKVKMDGSAELQKCKNENEALTKRNQELESDNRLLREQNSQLTQTLLEMAKKRK